MKKNLMVILAIVGVCWLMTSKKSVVSSIDLFEEEILGEVDKPKAKSYKVKKVSEASKLALNSEYFVEDICDRDHSDESLMGKRPHFENVVLKLTEVNGEFNGKISFDYYLPHSKQSVSFSGDVVYNRFALEQEHKHDSELAVIAVNGNLTIDSNYLNLTLNPSATLLSETGELLGSSVRGMQENLKVFSSKEAHATYLASFDIPDVDWQPSETEEAYYEEQMQNHEEHLTNVDRAPSTIPDYSQDEEGMPDYSTYSDLQDSFADGQDENDYNTYNFSN